MYYSAVEINNEINCFIKVYKVDGNSNECIELDAGFGGALLIRTLRHGLSKYQLNKLNSGKTIILKKDNPIVKLFSTN